MPWLPIYATERDLCQLLAYLNASEEIAFVVSHGQHRWIAVKTLGLLTDGRHCLWHVPSGPLPLFRGAGEAAGQITDPFAGWHEVKAGADQASPYFGAGHPGIIWLNAHSKDIRRPVDQSIVGLSSFEWVGNYFKIIGRAAQPETEKFWRALGHWVKKVTVKVPRGGPRTSTPSEIWAFSGAQAVFEAGGTGGDV
jgi:hypothetical protein